MKPATSKLEKAYARGRERGEVLNGSAGPSWAKQYLHDHARCLAQLLGWPKQKLVAEVRTYHQERLDAVPELTRYPELRGYRELLVEEFRGIRDAGVDDDTIALNTSLGFWRDTRLLQQTGRSWHAIILPEKCRVLYVPESDEGALHAKNVDENKRPR